MARGPWLAFGAAALLAARPGLAAEAAGPVLYGGLTASDVVVLSGLAIIASVIAVTLLAMIKVRRAHALYRDIFSAVQQPRQVVGPDGRILFANKPFLEIFGAVDKPVPELLAEQTAGGEVARDQIERLAAGARNGTPGHLELRVRPHKRGSEPNREAGPAEWRFVAAFPLPGRPGTVLWRVDDITARRQTEQVIREEQERFVDLLQYAPVGFYSVDGEGRFLFANQALRGWLGLSRDDLEGGRVRLHDLIAQLLDGIPAYALLPSGADALGEAAFKTADGGAFQASIHQDVVTGKDGAVLRAHSVVRNLTRERAMVEALERSEQRFERFFLEAPVGIALLDARGRLIECNRAFSAMVRQDAAGLTGKPLIDLIQPEDRDRVDRALRPSGEGAGPQAPVEVRLPGGGETVCAMYINGMTDAPGASGGYIAHFIDTTEQTNLERQFAQSQKMQAVGQLAGGIAHDFNNLLTAMIGFSDLLLLRHRPGDQSFADVMQIKQNANRAANLVRQLLAFSRQQTLTPRMLNVTDILAELSHLLRRLIGAGIDLQMVHGRDLGTVKADQGQLEQVIINLVVNARDAMSEGGTLTISTSDVKVGEESVHKSETMPPGDYVLIEVTDTGCGIPPEHEDRIFDPFFSTKEVGAGTGLGLSTVYGIVKQTGGFIDVDSDVGKGTTFKIYLPQRSPTEQEIAAAEEASARASRDLTGMGTVLLVEDEDAVRSFGARVLRNKGYDVLEARSGETALEIVKERGDTIDLLVTDVVMPRVDGPTLVRQVRETLPDLKVIFISGYTEDTFRKRLGEDAGIHFLPKPFSLKQLAGKVKEVIDDRQGAEGPGRSRNAV